MFFSGRCVFQELRDKRGEKEAQGRTEQEERTHPACSRSQAEDARLLTDALLHIFVCVLGCESSLEVRNAFPPSPPPATCEANDGRHYRTRFYGYTILLSTRS